MLILYFALFMPVTLQTSIRIDAKLRYIALSMCLCSVTKSILHGFIFHCVSFFSFYSSWFQLALKAVRFIVVVGDVFVCRFCITHHTLIPNYPFTPSFNTATAAHTFHTLTSINRLLTFTRTHVPSRATGKNNANNEEAKWLAVSLYSIVIVNGLLQIETPNQRGH